jgi:hypothetical protein
MPPSNLTVKKDNFKQVEAAIKDLVSRRIMVGVPSKEALRRPEPGETKPVNNAMLAYIHEHGCPACNIPARPFLEPTVAASKPVVVERLRAAAIEALKGRKTAVDQSLHALGLLVATAVKLKINTGPFQALAESTIAKRRARGRMGDKPLIDTGQLRNSISYVLRLTRGLS